MCCCLLVLCRRSFVCSIRRRLASPRIGRVMVCVLLLVEARGARSSPDRALAYLSARVHISEPGRLSLSDLIGRLAGRSIPNVTLQRLAEKATG